MKKGFTLLEILLVVAVMVILMSIVLAAINPVRQLAQSRDAQRKNDIYEIQKAVNQYYIDHKAYPAVPSQDNGVYEICNSQFSSSGKSCGVQLSLASMVPTYVTAIPNDPLVSKTKTTSGYNIALSTVTGIYVEAADTEIGVGASSTVLHVGQPPMGYDIPIVPVDSSSSGNTINKVKTYFGRTIAKLPDWTTPIIIFVAGFFIGFFLHVIIVSKKESDELKRRAKK